MPRFPVSKKIRRKPFPSCAHQKRIAPPPIFGAGAACRLNGAAQAVGHSRWLAVRWSAFLALPSGWQPQRGDPVNAIVNYAYAALESEIRIRAISDGYNPTIDIMHEGSDGSSKFIFDLMEPERPKVDRAVLDFVTGHVFDPADFVIRSDGVCRLNPEMARMVVGRRSA